MGIGLIGVVQMAIFIIESISKMTNLETYLATLQYTGLQRATSLPFHRDLNLVNTEFNLN